MEEFPDKIYGVCPIGHNPRPDDETGSNLSTTLIDEGEGRRLFWSGYYQKYVCSFCLARVQDEIDDDRSHQKLRDFDRKLASIGFRTQID